MSNKAGLTLGDGGKVEIEQETRYPWSGDIQVSVRPEKAGTFTLKLRVPGWARGEAVPGDLYRFVDEKVRDAVTLRVNHETMALKLDNGYATITREWKTGDKVELHLPMPVERVAANEKVEADRGHIALQRGPIVFCAESADSADKHVRNLVLTNTEKLHAEFLPAKLNGIEELRGQAVGYRYDRDGQLQHQTEEFTAIPYYAWANRGRGQMEVWFAESASEAHPTPYPTIASMSAVTVSGTTEAANGARDPQMVADLEEPTSSSDSSSYYDWWPKKGTIEWIQYKFSEAKTVSNADVYWFAQKNGGGVALPKAWRVLYLSGSEWKPVEATTTYEVAADRYNRVAFQPVKTSALRLEVTLQDDKSAGVSEWKVK
jgi:hypothetical protein